MRNKFSPKLSRHFLEAASKISFWGPVDRNGWRIRFSIHNHQSVIISAVSAFSGQYIIKFFNDEDKAVDFLELLSQRDPRKPI
jgi:hypothetical protein